MEESSNLPVLLFLHGASKSGDSFEDLEKLRTAVIPKYIEGGQWGDLPFLVICPQVYDGWHPDNIMLALRLIKQYEDNADLSRLYITGQSMGGGGIWRYLLQSKQVADEFAAAIVVCGAASPPDAQPKNGNGMVLSNLPVWAFHNDKDNTIPMNFSKGWVDLNNKGGITPQSKLTILDNTGHDAWTAAFNPDKSSPNYVYDWLLSYTNKRA
ncbi:hypothetical protein SAMD00019534_073810 [Acytostelium subglobosum LB1]|uniref:hypothetical protein n=1 Tax=Acytostelium subglobosum LB1 TaxID=1410327 RepID=UPI0006448951|nr:hypothetical protein SAMD00019534_073810 [Acytostelium subglobosum LB1]GAM24206.1 hypothetical protein SAMD00019534_073810 [Acytostelium subglobosum LB1]|eukprot:XP_012752532.1 hypothetical protein SAMD00019534_073810 [Acytostelium subglobosum LB1]